jgi:hypothetical protein
METYAVKFWIQKPDGFWEQRSEIISAKGKNAHIIVECLWRVKYKGQKVRLIAVIYQ